MNDELGLVENNELLVGWTSRQVRNVSIMPNVYIEGSQLAQLGRNKVW